MEGTNMSTSETTPAQTVPVHLACMNAPWQLRLYNQQRDEVASGFGSLHTQVTPGIYQLVVDAGAVRTPRMLMVGPSGFTDNQISVDFPSAAPLPATSTTHEFHRGPAEQLSRA